MDIFQPPGSFFRTIMLILEPNLYNFVLLVEYLQETWYKLKGYNY